MKPSVWIKKFLPRSLYGRAALILIVPVVTLQIVVSSVFLQRHFEDVTRQMTVALSLDFNLVVQTLERAGPQAAERLADALEIEIGVPGDTTGFVRPLYDLSGAEVVAVLQEHVPGLLAVDLRNFDRQVYAVVETAEGPVSLSTSRRRASARAPHQLLVIMGLTGIMMTLVAYLFLRNQLKPIRRLALAADAFGKGRRLPYSPSGATEVRSAGRAFLDMRERIEGHIEQRTLMLSGVSHDLRTPLTRMRLGLGMMEEGPDQEALIHDVDEMEALVNTFLDFVRGDALDDPVPSDPHALLTSIVEDARRGGGDVSLELPDAVDPVVMRPMAVQRAVSNLVSNALRYGKRAAVSMAVQERTLRITVEDAGPGIPAHQRKDALRPFIRLDNARNQNQGSGVGLGLAIAQDITRRHGGSLALGDSATMGGLRVDMILPR